MFLMSVCIGSSSSLLALWCTTIITTTTAALLYTKTTNQQMSQSTRHFSSCMTIKQNAYTYNIYITNYYFSSLPFPIVLSCDITTACPVLKNGSMVLSQSSAIMNCRWNLQPLNSVPGQSSCCRMLPTSKVRLTVQARRKEPRLLSLENHVENGFLRG